MNAQKELERSNRLLHDKFEICKSGKTQRRWNAVKAGARELAG